MHLINSRSSWRNWPGKALHIGERRILLQCPVPNISNVIVRQTDTNADTHIHTHMYCTIVTWMAWFQMLPVRKFQRHYLSNYTHIMEIINWPQHIICTIISKTMITTIISIYSSRRLKQFVDTYFAISVHDFEQFVLTVNFFPHLLKEKVSLKVLYPTWFERSTMPLNLSCFSNPVRLTW